MYTTIGWRCLEHDNFQWTHMSWPLFAAPPCSSSRVGSPADLRHMRRPWQPYGQPTLWAPPRWLLWRFLRPPPTCQRAWDRKVCSARIPFRPFSLYYTATAPGPSALIDPAASFLATVHNPALSVAASESPSNLKSLAIVPDPIRGHREGWGGYYRAPLPQLLKNV